MAWLSVWSEVQTCICSSWCHCHSLFLASAKSRFVLPFWYRLTRVVLEKGPLKRVCVLLASSLRHKVVIEHREIFIQSQPYTQFFFSVVAQWQARSLFPQKCCNNRSNFYKLDTIPVAPNHWKQLSSITISRNHICNETCNVTFCTYCGFTEISRSIVFSRSSSSMHFFICSAPAQTNML